jgi:cation diffusion facilitator CzcD-associated flavoprotein CzcO
LESTSVVIIGAGPYGLSLATHLKARGVAFRIFGEPMHSWRTQMPRGMHLKSEGFASCLDDPDGTYRLANFCQERGLPYRDVGSPVPIETFIEYGMAFQQRFVPSLEEKKVTQLASSHAGFVLRLDDGETMTARQVVVAVGVGHFPHLPPELAAMSDEHLSHSSHHAELDRFCGKDVIVIGAGASAVDLAALLHEAGSSVRLVARRRSIEFHAPPERRPRRLSERLRNPRSGLGLGWRSRLCEDAPLVFRMMPEDFRLRVVSRHLGPAPGWFVRDRVERHVPMLLGSRLVSGASRGDRAQLRIANDTGHEQLLEADHVIAATGYRVDLRRLSLLAPATLGQIRMADHTPVLSTRFEASLPGLHFVGPAAANCFGPLMRFACGNRFVARRLAPYIAARA